MSVMKGKKEVRTHLPLETYKYLKTHATLHGMGTMIANAIDLYAKQGDIAKRIITIEGNYLAPLFVNSQTDKANKLW